MKNYKNVSNVFILSSGRSGSTLLSNLLNAHSKLLSVPESTFLITLSSLYKNKTRFTDKDYQEIINLIWLRKAEMKALWNINKTELLATLQKENPQSLKFIFQLIYLSYNGVGAKKAPIIIDKNPFYFQFIHQIKNIYPKAKYIILVRDYRDRYVSLRDNKYANEIAGKLVQGISWNSRNKALLKMHKEADTGTTLLIKYEELVLNPEKEIEKICQFLTISYESTMLDFYKNNQHNYNTIQSSKKLRAHIIELHKNSNTQIKTDKIGIWKKKLDQRTISILETYCGETGELFGYAKSTKNSVFANFVNRLQLLPSIIKGLIFRFLKIKSFSLPYPIQKGIVKVLKPQ